MAEKKSDTDKKDTSNEAKETEEPREAVDVKPAGDQPRDEKAAVFEPGVEG